MKIRLTLAIAAAIAAAPASAVTVGASDNGNCYPFNCNDSGTSVGQSIRYMQIYAASAFSGVTSFSKISFSAFTGTGAASVLTGNYAISFHTTSGSIGVSYPIAPLANSASFFNGALGSGPAFGAYSIMGSTYSYDPMDGNLVMEIVVTNQANTPNGAGGGYFFADYTGSVTTRAYDLTGSGPQSGTGGLVTTFGAVPEPESWALMIAGFGLTGLAMRRRIRAVAA